MPSIEDEYKITLPDGETEPTRYAWMRDGMLVAGTLAEWARMWKDNYYAGDDDMDACLRTWHRSGGAVEEYEVQVKRGETTDNDYIPYTISAGGESLVVMIGGRA